jgi:hypothetical protein
MDDADIAADLAERERQALIARHRARVPLPPTTGGRFAPARTPTHLRDVMDRETEEPGK